MRPTARTALGASAFVAVVAAAAPPAGADVFSSPVTIGSTTADVGHLSFQDGAGRGVVAASAGRALFLAPVTVRGFGSLRQARLRAVDHDLGPFVATDRLGRVLIVEIVRGRPFAVRFDASGRRRSTQALARGSASAVLVANPRGDALVTLHLDGGGRRDLFARAGSRFRRIPSPPRSPGQSPNIHVDPAGRLLAVDAHAGRLHVARRGTRGRWSPLRTVYSDPNRAPIGNTPVDFAPDGDALLVFTTGTYIRAAWARRGRAFGRPKTIAPLEGIGPEIHADLDLGGRASVVWTDPDTTVHASRGRFGRGFTRAWDSPRTGNVDYIETAGEIVTWQETRDVGAPQTIHAATVGAGAPREEVVDSAPAGTTLYSPRLSVVAGRPLLVWVQQDAARKTFRGAAGRRIAATRP